MSKFKTIEIHGNENYVVKVYKADRDLKRASKFSETWKIPEFQHWMEYLQRESEILNELIETDGNDATLLREYVSLEKSLKDKFSADEYDWKSNHVSDSMSPVTNPKEIAFELGTTFLLTAGTEWVMNLAIEGQHIVPMLIALYGTKNVAEQLINNGSILSNKKLQNSRTENLNELSRMLNDYEEEYGLDEDNSKKVKQ